MTFRINSFLRANGPVPEPDLDQLAFLDDYFLFSGTHCLLRHHAQWIRPLQFGLFYTSIPTLIRLSTSFYELTCFSKRIQFPQIPFISCD